MPAMQADKFGTPVEQRRHRAHWIASSLRQAHPTYQPSKRCSSCVHAAQFVGHRCQKHGFATQANAVCADHQTRPH